MRNIPIVDKIGALCNDDYKGANRQYVDQGKVIVVAWEEWQFGDYRKVSIAGTLRAHGGSYGWGSETIVGEEKVVNEDGKGRVWESDKVASLTAMGGKPGQGYPCVRQETNMAIDAKNFVEGNVNGTLTSAAAHNVDSNNVVRQKYAVRRLTPLECERLQGLPDNWTFLPGEKTCSDSARYKAIGNGMSQPCADFVLKRIVEEIGSD